MYTFNNGKWLVEALAVDRCVFLSFFTKKEKRHFEALFSKLFCLKGQLRLIKINLKRIDTVVWIYREPI